MLTSLTVFLAVSSLSSDMTFSSQELWDAWPQERFVSTPAPCLKHADLEARLRDLRDQYPEDLSLEQVGASFQGRSIHLLTVGRGARKVLLWSQMHGDEPSATPALLDIVHFLLSHPEDRRAARILGELTLLIVPQLNPDGAEVYRRRNAQGIDMNRDALNLATPEGALLKRLRDEHLPILGFNLHDQERGHSVGDTGVLATNALLAVSGDAANTLTPGRQRAKRVCSAIAEALAPLMPGGMARYDETFSPRSFGDNITAWGTPVVLLESGGLPPGRPAEDLTRLNFVGLLRALEDLARNDATDHDPAVYEGLPDNNNGEWVDVAVRGGRLLQPGTGVSYRADLGIDVGRSDQEWAGCASGPVPRASSLVEVGDARLLFAGRDVVAAESLITAPLVVGIEGFAAREHLNDAGLHRLARLGVGTVRWHVADEDQAAAKEHAATLDVAGLPRVEVACVCEAMPSLTFDDSALSDTAVRADATSGAPSLADVLARLGGAVDSPSMEDFLGRVTADLASDGGFRPGQPASFLIWWPLVDGRPDPQRTKLRAVWIDGREAGGDE